VADARGATITTVLVVDDHVGVRLALEALIRSTADLRVVGSASGGAEAIELVAALEPAVVVMDLAMPGTSGVQAIRAICRRRPAPAVVAFSGARTLWREARAAGAAYTVLKDDDPERLLDTIRSACGR
jgi:DNA-binding NarL/FixJ family response regulator